MTTSTTGQSVSRRTALAGLGAGGLGVALAATARSAAAQDAATEMAKHPIVGGWKGINAPIDPIATTYALFHADGTNLEVTVGAGTGVGVWRATGAHRRPDDLLPRHQSRPDRVRAGDEHQAAIDRGGRNGKHSDRAVYRRVDGARRNRHRRRRPP
jgi:hypothetical protein